MTDLEQYGLSEPSQTIQITTSDQTYTLCIGNYNSIIGEYYVYADDASTVYTVTSTAVTAFEKGLEDVKIVEETVSDGDSGISG